MILILTVRGGASILHHPLVHLATQSRSEETPTLGVGNNLFFPASSLYGRQGQELVSKIFKLRKKKRDSFITSVSKS